MTSQEPENPYSADSGIPDTEVIEMSAPAPVFVDATGRRRRFLRRLSYGFGALCMLYGGLVSVSLAGGPVSSSAVLPLPDLVEDAPDLIDARPAPQPSPAPAQKASPRPRLVTEALRRPDIRVARRAEAPRSPAPKVARSAPAKPKPAKPRKSPTPRPVESGTTGAPIPSDPASPSPVVPAPTPPDRTLPVRPEPPHGGTGGSAPDGAGAGAGVSDEPGSGDAVSLPAAEPSASAENPGGSGGSGGFEVPADAPGEARETEGEEPV